MTRRGKVDPDLPKAMGGEWFHQRPDGSLDNFYTDNYLGQGRFAYSTHGSNGQMMARDGAFKPAQWVIEHEVETTLQKINLPKRHSVTFLVCDSDSFGQLAANKLGRRVHTFKGIVYVDLVYPLSTADQFSRLYPMRAAGNNEAAMRRLLGVRADWVEVEPVTYYPLWRPWA